jgi:dTMP kinase
MLISFEGIDGCGKSTQAVMLRDWLSNRGYQVRLLREPGGTPLGELIRSALLDPANTDMSPRSELFLYLAARAQLTDTVIEPSLSRGETIILDRYIDSTAAYQGVARGLGLDEVSVMNYFATNGLVPDATLFIDTDPVTALSRLSGSPDRLESEGISFMERVRDGYLRIDTQGHRRFCRIDGNRSVADVFSDIVGFLSPMLVSSENI